MSKCPCQSGKHYKLCCKRYHLGKIQAPTAESLMRSRYSAYVLNLPQYVYRTWYSKTRPPLQELRKSTSQNFVMLQIIDTQFGLETDETGTVTFIATFEENGQKKEHKEKSEFRRENKKWVYYSNT
ncbi:MAG TPA: hypothetical protein EYH38_02875 [Leucothrix sp.]|nr:hypothetical protein [Leucothrix sp.]